MVSLGGIARKIFGSSNDRRIKKIRNKVKEINALEAEISALSDAELQGKTAEFRASCRMARRLTTFWLRHLPWRAKHQSVRSACAPLTYS